MVLTTVINRHHGVPFDVYIGRGTLWGNPFEIGRDGGRDEVVEKYRAWFVEKVKEPAFRAQTIALRGLRLGCSCAPSRCHGDVIAEWLHHPASLLAIRESWAWAYGPRTKENAKAADLTAAFAIDFDTRGEILTREAAGERYIAIPLGTPVQDAAQQLSEAMRCRNAKTLNIAGNGIYTLAGAGWDQARTNRWLYDVLGEAQRLHPIEGARSGGQTGVDLGGGIAALAHGLPTTLLLPKGFRQRDVDGRDSNHTFAQIWQQVSTGLSQLTAPCGKEHQ